MTFIMAANGLTLDAPSLPVPQLFPGTNMEELYLTMFKTGRRYTTAPGSRA